MALRVLLAYDQELVRTGLLNLLTQNGLRIIAEASDGWEAVRLARKESPEVAVLDLSMPKLNGLDAAREILRGLPKTKIIVLTVHTEDHYVLEALRAGVHGYVLKSQGVSDLVQAIHEVSRGNKYLCPGVTHAVVEVCLTKSELPVDPLTVREREVLQLVAEGRTTKEIAGFLGVSIKTAEWHRGRGMEKLKIHNTAGLVRYAIRRGLIQA